MQTYQHSGAVPLTGLILAGATGLAVAAVLGVLYSYLVCWIPFVYVNIIVTCAFGVAIGWTVGRAAKAGKIRNTLVVGLLGLGFGLVGLYVAWGADLLARGGLKYGLLAFDPLVLLRYIRVFYENGFWGMGEGENLKGVFLALIWLAEAGIIVWLATILAIGSIASLSFCERCNRWTTAEEGVQKLLVEPGQESIVEAAATGDIVPLKDLYRAPDDAAAYLQLDVAHCDTCSESNFLTIQMVTHTEDKKGNLQKRRSPWCPTSSSAKPTCRPFAPPGRSCPRKSRNVPRSRRRPHRAMRTPRRRNHGKPASTGVGHHCRLDSSTSFRLRPRKSLCKTSPKGLSLTR